MKFRHIALSLLTATAFAVAPLSPASAHEYYHHRHEFPLFGLFHAAGAVVVGAAEVATAPVRIIANAAAPYPYQYAQPQAYAAPVYYAAPPAPVAYAYPPPVVYYQQPYGYYR
jgi:hypothetical protein